MRSAVRRACIHTGLAECLRSELALYGISVHIYFPATILSPGYEQENRTKPALTREIEGADEGQTPAQCAQHMLRGVERDYFAITDGLIGQFLRISSAGCAPGHVWALDTLLALPARVRGTTHAVGARWLAPLRGRRHRTQACAEPRQLGPSRSQATVARRSLHTSGFFSI